MQTMILDELPISQRKLKQPQRNTANDTMARRAYRKLMLKIHPDKYRGDESKLPAEMYDEAAKLAGEAMREYEEDGRGELAPQ